MTVAEFHPEELFDKLLEGQLSLGERARLRSHLDACPVCRFEYAARLDFEAEASHLGSEQIPALPLALSGAAAAARPRGSRALYWGLVAAGLICASGALAAALDHAPWRAFAHTSLTDSGSHPRGAAVARSSAAPAVAHLAPAPAVAPVAGTGPRLPEAKRVDPSRSANARPPAPLREGRVQRGNALEPTAADLATAPDASTSAASPALPSAATLFAEGNQARRGGDADRASALYRLLQERYPGSAEAELSRVTLATSLLDSGDPASALLGFERYLAGPSRALEVEALVGRARALQRLGRTEEERLAWQQVKQRFPRSVYARQADDRLTTLGTP